MKKEIIVFILLAIITGLFFMLSSLDEKTVTKLKCNKVFSQSYFLRIIEKKIIVNDHGRRQILCLNLKNDSIMEFSPSYILPANAIYDLVSINDTLLKERNSFTFKVRNKNTKNNFIFNCDW